MGFAVIVAAFAGPDSLPLGLQAQTLVKAGAATKSLAGSPSGTVLHLSQRGDTMPGLIRKYLSASSFMTGAELQAAIRANNPPIPAVYLKPGQSIVIPGMNGPVVEKPLGLSKDFEVRAIYLTGVMAGSAKGLDIVRHWREVGGNAVVFDIKDSDGVINIPFEHPLNANASRPVISNLPKYTRWLHQQGMVAIGRIAIFRDERMVTRHPELAIRSRKTGEPWRENGKLVWTDPSRPEIQGFNIDLAKLTAGSGLDEVQFDYVRFPAEGDQADAQFVFQTVREQQQASPAQVSIRDAHPGVKSQQASPTRADVIAGFLSRAHHELQPMKVLLSVDVFGVMAWQRTVDLAHTGQDIVLMAQHCDVLSPMIYPSHFYGMDGYALPGDAPEHFIASSMDRFRKITASSSVVLRPWLQAFGWRTKTYSPEYVSTQVRVARKKNGNGFLLWNARNDYSKPMSAMPEMRRDSGKFFREDEITPHHLRAATPSGSPGGSTPALPL